MPGLLLGRHHQAAAQPEPAGTAMDEELGDLRPVRLVRRHGEVEEDGPIEAAIGERREDHDLATFGPLDHPAPEGTRPLGLQRVHEADRGTALDGIDKEVCQVIEKGRGLACIEAADAHLSA